MLGKYLIGWRERPAKRIVERKWMITMARGGEMRKRKEIELAQEWATYVQDCTRTWF